MLFFLFFRFHPEGKSKKEKGAPIQRSTETGMAVELTRNMSRQPSRESNNGSMNSYNSEGKSVNHTLPVLINQLHTQHISFLYICFSLKGECQMIVNFLLRLLYISPCVFRTQCLYIFFFAGFSKSYTVKATVA